MSCKLPGVVRNDAPPGSGLNKKMNRLLGLRAAIVSLALLSALLFLWHDATRSSSPNAAAAVVQGKPAMPGPLVVGSKLLEHLRDPFAVKGSDNSLVLQIGYSLTHAAAGFLLAMLVALPLGFLSGLSPLLRQSLAPFIQLLRPVALAWIPLALYFFRNSGPAVVLVTFACALWPMLLHTSGGVFSVRKDWIDMARTLEVGPIRRARTIVLPAAAPALIAGMRLSAGIAWAAAIAAEMLASGTGIGAFLLNEWYSLSFANVVVAIFAIGAVGMAIDQFLAHCGRAVSYRA